MEKKTTDRLAQLKEKQRRKLHVADQIERGINDWLEILRYVRDRHLPHAIAQLAPVSPEEVELWETHFNGEPLAPFGFTRDMLVVGDALPIRVAVEERYPSTHVLRYVPDLPEIHAPSGSEAHLGIRTAIAALGLPLDREVLFFHQRYWPVLRLPLAVLAEHSEALFDPWHADALVFPDDMAWLIAQTIEGTWHAGHGADNPKT